MKNISVSGLVMIAVLSAIVATLCDAIHVFTDTLAYPQPLWLGQAFWVFPGFVIAFSAMSLIYAGLVDNLGGTLRCEQSASGRASPLPFVECMTLFAITYALSGFGNFEPFLLGVLFYGTFLIRLCASYERAFLLLIAVLLGVGGMFGEGLLIQFGLVEYRHVDIFGVPYWLGGLYMHGAFALREAVRLFLFRHRPGGRASAASR